MVSSRISGHCPGPFAGARLRAGARGDSPGPYVPGTENHPPVVWTLRTAITVSVRQAQSPTCRLLPFCVMTGRKQMQQSICANAPNLSPRIVMLVPSRSPAPRRRFLPHSLHTSGTGSFVGWLISHADINPIPKIRARLRAPPQRGADGEAPQGSGRNGRGLEDAGGRTGTRLTLTRPTPPRQRADRPIEPKPAP